MNDKASTAAVIAVAAFGLVGVIACLSLLHIWTGFVLSIMWGWFAVPLGLPAISIPMAIGLALTGKMMLGFRGGKAENGMKAWINTICVPLFALAIGWIVKGCM